MLTWTIEDGLPIIRAKGKLTREDYDTIEPELTQVTSQESEVRLLLELEDFEGWDPGAFVKDLELSLRHRFHIDRLAVVGHQGDERVRTKLTQPLFGRHVRLFRREQGTEARAWLRGGVGGR